MSLLTRFLHLLCRGRTVSEIDEELADHLAEAVERGRSPGEAARALGNPVRLREASTEIKLLPWLDSLRADAVFAWRQLRRRPIVSAAAVLSLGLGIGSTLGAFRLIDAVLLRPLPVAEPEFLQALATTYVDDRTPAVSESESFSYPSYKLLLEAARGRAELMVISHSNRMDLTIGDSPEMEKVYRQYVSGNYFPVLGLRPAAGRLLSPEDDKTPGGHPVAVISHDFWRRRFGADPKAVGSTFRLDDTLYEIVGVGPENFTGTEPGRSNEIFLPVVQNSRPLTDPQSQWIRIWARIRPDQLEPTRQAWEATIRNQRAELVKAWPRDVPVRTRESFTNTSIRLLPAASGVSGLQRRYRRPLEILGAVALLVMLISVANVANLLSAQAAARAKELALRVSIGAGRFRLLQLMLVESTLIAAFAAAVGLVLAWVSVPYVVGLVNPPDDPLRLRLPMDWRLAGFAALLALTVTLLFGLAPAIRASGVEPVAALKGGADPHSQRRFMNVLVAAQVAFCFLVHFLAGLFLSSFQRLANEPTGFTSERVWLLDVASKTSQSPAVWKQLSDSVREAVNAPAAGLASWPLMGNSSWRGNIRFGDGPMTPDAPYFLSVSPGWLDTMRIDLVSGRDFRAADTPPRLDADQNPVEGVALVNEAFARRYFNGESPLGRTFQKLERRNKSSRAVIVGMVRDARYANLREPMAPTIYIPLGADSWSTLLVRAPTADAASLRLAVRNANSAFRVSNVSLQADLVRNQTLRERLLATLSFFFAVVALALAAVGLYGVLGYAVEQRRREIGIRMALGARAGHVARDVSIDVFWMLLLGSAVGLAAGIASEQYVTTLLHGVKPNDWRMLSLPAAVMLAASVVAALPPVLRAVRIDPARALRAD